MSVGVRRIDIRIVQSSEAVLVHIRNSSPTLEVEEILAPIHTKAGAHGNDAGLFQFIIVILLAILGRYFNLAIIRRSDIGMIDFGPQAFLVAGRTNRSIGHSTADAYFLAAYGYAARHCSLLGQFFSRNGKFLHIIQFGISACGLAINDALCVVDTTVDGHGSHCTGKRLAETHIYAASHRQSLTLVGGCQFDGVIRTVCVQSDGVPGQICSGGVVKRIVCQRQPHGRALASCYFASNIDDGSLVLCLFADIFTRNGIVGKGDLGIILQVIPAAGAGSVEGLTANSHTCANGNNGGVAGSLAVHRICRDVGVLDVCYDIVLHIVVGNTCTGSHITAKTTRHSGSNGKAMIFTQFLLGSALVLRGSICNLAFVSIFYIIIQSRLLVTILQIDFPRSINAFFFQGVLILFIRVHCVFQQGFGLRIQFAVVLYLLFFIRMFRICLLYRDFTGLNIY